MLKKIHRESPKHQCGADKQGDTNVELGKAIPAREGAASEPVQPAIRHRRRSRGKNKAIDGDENTEAPLLRIVSPPPGSKSVTLTLWRTSYHQARLRQHWVLLPR
jgi:hypothetical protein